MLFRRQASNSTPLWGLAGVRQNHEHMVTVILGLGQAGPCTERTPAALPVHVTWRFMVAAEPRVGSARNPFEVKSAWG
jgi:hypothetical protein